MKFFCTILLLLLVACSKTTTSPESALQDFIKTKTTDLKIESANFKVLSKTCQETKCSITYSIIYKTELADKTVSSSEVHKIAQMVQHEEKWLIADVSNIKTSIESLEPISL